MPDATITSTASTFGTISGTFLSDQSTVTGTVAGTVVGTLSGSVGVPGPQGPTGPQGPEGPEGPPGEGGTWGSIVGTLSNQTDLQSALDGKYSTSNPSGYITSSALTPYLPKAGGVITGDIQSNNGSAYRSYNGTYKTSVLNSEYLQLNNADVGGNALTVEWNGITFASGKQTVHYPGTSILSGYATESWVTAGFAPIAAGMPTSGTVGQVLTKNSGTNYDASWATLIPGDRYLTTSTTSNSVSNGVKTFTVQTGLSYSSQQDVVISYDASNHMHAVVTSYNSGTGALVVDVTNHTGSGTYSAWTVNVGGTTPVQSIVWGDITGTLGNQSDLATALNAKLETSTAASTYYLQTNPAGYITSAALSGYATQAWVDAQGYLQAGALTGYALESWVTAQGYLTSSALTGYALESWVTSQGYITDAPSDSQTYGRNNGAWVVAGGGGGYITSVTSPLSVTGSDLSIDLSAYETTANAAATYYPLSNPSAFIDASALSPYLTSATAASTYYPLIGNPSSFLVAADIAGKANLSGATFTGEIVLPASTTTTASLTIPHGTAPTTPVNGEVWTTTSGLFARINGGTQQYAPLGSTNTFSGSNTFSNANNTFGNSTATGTTNIASGATLSGSTKTVNLGTSGVAGSTTNIAIGSTTGTSTTTLQGITNGVTQSAGDSSLKLATTAFVTTADNLKANLASPTFTGTPAAPTAAVDTNTTQLATTAYVIGQGYLKSATASSTYAPLASPALTGTPTAPTATAGTNTTQIATTAFVTAAVPATATHLQALQFASTTAVAKVADAASQIVAPSVLCVWPSPSNYNGTATSGTGASASLYLTGYVLGSPNAGIAGNARAYHGNISGDLGYMMWGGSTNSQVDFSKRVSMSFRFSQYPSDANSVTRVLLGKIHGAAVGDLASAGIGVKYIPTASTYYFQLQVHNGTTLTTVQSSTQYAGGCADLEVVSNGSGTATLYLNGTQVATTTGAPTAATAANATVFAEVESQATTTVRPVASVGRLFVNSNNF